MPKLISRFVLTGVGLAFGALPAPQADAGTASPWKTFASRGGWSIDYPRGWTASSCNNCRDAAAPGMYVGFEGGAGDDDFLIVQPLADKPADKTVRQWLDEVIVTANLNTVLHKRATSLNGHFAMVVRYRYADHSLGDETYVVDGARTFQIGAVPVGSASAPILRHMVATFKTRPISASALTPRALLRQRQQNPHNS